MGNVDARKRGQNTVQCWRHTLLNRTIHNVNTVTKLVGSKWWLEPQGTERRQNGRHGRVLHPVFLCYKGHYVRARQRDSARELVEAISVCVKVGARLEKRMDPESVKLTSLC